MSHGKGKQEVKRIRRLLEMVWLLQGPGRWTREILAQRYQVSERTIGRDVQLLIESCVPIEDDGKDFALPVDQLSFTQLSREEIVSLAITGPRFHWPQMSRFQQTREVALAKLLTAAREEDRDKVEHLLAQLTRLVSHSDSAPQTQPDQLEENVLYELIETWLNAPVEPKRRRRRRSPQTQSVMAQETAEH